MQSGRLTGVVVVPRVCDEFLDVPGGRQVHLVDRRQIPTEDRAARHEEGLWIQGRGVRKVAVGHEIARAFAVAFHEPVLVKATDGEQVGYIDLGDELAHQGDDLGDLLQPHLVDRGRRGARARMHADGRGNAPDEHVRMRILAAEDGLQLHDLTLPGERVQVMRHGHEVGLGRQPVA